MSKYFYITTPIYYVNDVPHIGHAYTTLMADTIARFKQIDGYEVKFLTGTDEHGQKVEKSAKQMGVEPQKFVDDVSQVFRKLTQTMQVGCSDFIRTTEPHHYKAVESLWNTLIESGDIYLGSYDGWYAVRDEAFYSEKELINGKAPTGADVEWVSEPSYFFKLSKWQDKLLEYYKNHPDFIGPDSRRNEVIRFVESGLVDLSVSRTTFSWGIKVPSDPSHVIYVWLDALTNYITALGYPNQDENFKNFWQQGVHIVGKDILRFHAVYWPAFLMAAGIDLPKCIYAHGWWTNEGEKISKSLGNTIDPFELIETFGIDAVRYFMIREVPFGQDGNFSRQGLINRINSDLANSYGNLVQRVLSFIHKHCNEKIPNPNTMQSEDHDLMNLPLLVLPELYKHMNEFALNRYAESIWGIIFKANQYIDEQKPWSLKNDNVDRMHTVLYVLAETIRKIAILTQPILPIGSEKILNFFNIPNDQKSLKNLDTALVGGSALLQPTGVYPRYAE